MVKTHICYTTENSAIELTVLTAVQLVPKLPSASHKVVKIGEDIILVVVAIRVAKAGFKFRVKGGTNFLKSLMQAL